MFLGKIVKSYSHINYVCQIYGPHEMGEQPRPVDYAFGCFVRVALNEHNNEGAPWPPGGNAAGNANEPGGYAVGVIYDTILQNPDFGTLGPRLSNEAQVELFSPDYVAEKAVLIYLIVLGMIEPLGNTRNGRFAADGGNAPGPYRTMHGVPPLALELGSEVETMGEEEVQAFHFFGDAERADDPRPYLHMGYLPHIISQGNSLLPQVTLRIIDQLERLFPQNLALLSIVKRNFAWRLKVETTG